MKKIKLFIVLLLFASGIISAQTLQVPTELTQRQDSIYWGGNIPFFITSWQNASWISNNETISGTSIYLINDNFSPSNGQLNEIEQSGGNIVDWAMYFKASDSTFFSEQVPSYLGGNIYRINGRNTLELKTWGDYFKESHEIYYNTYNCNYVILAATDEGEFLDLETIIDLRNEYTGITGYYTKAGFADITQSNLVIRYDW